MINEKERIHHVRRVPFCRVLCLFISHITHLSKLETPNAHSCSQTFHPPKDTHLFISGYYRCWIYEDLRSPAWLGLYILSRRISLHGPVNGPASLCGLIRDFTLLSITLWYYKIPAISLHPIYPPGIAETPSCHCFHPSTPVLPVYRSRRL